MSVGILTYHNTRNFGAALQAYALLRACLEIDPGSEIIDYRSSAMAAAKEKSVRTGAGSLPQRTRKLLQAPLARMKSRAFDSFQRDYLTLSEKSFLNDESLRVDLPDYDVVLVGSDQVWNYEINGSDINFFGAFARPDTKVASYASSFGISFVPEGLISDYQEGLRRIDPIGVREPLGAELVRQLIGRTAQVLPDPVMLRTPEEWRSFYADKRKKAVPEALVTYFLGGHAVTTKGERIVSQSGLNRYARTKLAGALSARDLWSRKVDVQLDRGPRDFVESIDNAAFVLTDSFHATMMSIILDRPFGVLLKGNAGKDARILGVLERFDLMNRVVDAPTDLILDRPSNNTSLTRSLDDSRGLALDFLQRAIAT